jgi:hypothetical protein
MLTSPSYSAMVARPKCNLSWRVALSGVVSSSALSHHRAAFVQSPARKQRGSDVHGERRIVDLHCARQRLDRTGQPGQVVAVEPDQCGREH